MNNKPVRKFHVEIKNTNTPEWNKHFDFIDFDQMVAYCKELNFQGHTFTIYAYDDYDGTGIE